MRYWDSEGHSSHSSGTMLLHSGKPSDSKCKSDVGRLLMVAEAAPSCPGSQFLIAF